MAERIDEGMFRTVIFLVHLGVFEPLSQNRKSQLHFFKYTEGFAFCNIHIYKYFRIVVRPFYCT